MPTSERFFSRLYAVTEDYGSIFGGYYGLALDGPVASGIGNSQAGVSAAHHAEALHFGGALDSLSCSGGDPHGLHLLGFEHYAFPAAALGGLCFVAFIFGVGRGGFSAG